MKILLLKNKKIKDCKDIDVIKKTISSFSIDYVEKDIQEVDTKTMDKNLSMVIAIGGDGTIIKGAKIALDMDVPICGINAGHLGFLTGIDLDNDIVTNINKILDGQYNIDKRTLLDVEVITPDGQIKYKDVAINEAQSLSSDLNSMSHFDIYIDEKKNFLYEFASCGFLISTPTGSTGFSFSAGGPIVSPKAECVVIQALYPHAFYQRAFVIEDSKVIFVVISDYNQSLYIDGQKLIVLDKNDIIKIRKSERKVSFIELTDDVFFKNLTKKIRSI